MLQTVIYLYKLDYIYRNTIRIIKQTNKQTNKQLTANFLSIGHGHSVYSFIPSSTLSPFVRLIGCTV